MIYIAIGGIAALLLHGLWMRAALRDFQAAVLGLIDTVETQPRPRVRRSTPRTQPTAPVTVDRSEQERMEILRRQTMPRNQNPLDDEEDDSLLVVPE